MIGGIIAASDAAVLADFAGPAYARPAGVNRPELLPTEQTPVIDVAGFLTASEVRIPLSIWPHALLLL
jgi:hypothetical protein